MYIFVASLGFEGDWLLAAVSYSSIYRTFQNKLCQAVQGTFRGAGQFSNYMKGYHRCLKVLMPEQLLYLPDIDSA